MVWPIFISVAVTPRISAAGSAAGQASTAIAPRTPQPVTKRIDVSSDFFVRVAVTAVRPALAVSETCMTPGCKGRHEAFSTSRNHRNFVDLAAGGMIAHLCLAATVVGDL